MKKREPITHIMQSDLVTINKDKGTLLEAKQLMERHNIRHLPVVSGNNHLEGIISLTDILRISYGSNFDNEDGVDYAIFNMLSIPQVMKSSPKTVKETATIKEVAEILAVEEFHALPVVDDTDQLKGIVTTTDLIRFLLEQY